MPKQKSNLSSLVKLFIALLIIYLISRLLFYFFHITYFNDLSFSQLAFLLLVGIKFDLSILLLLNFLFIILYLFPISFREHKIYQLSIKWLFIISNCVAILANCIDLAYFPFTFKRTTADVFNFFGGEIGNDLGNLLPLFLKEYWYVFLIWLVLSVILTICYKRIVKQENKIWNKDYYIKSFGILFLAIGLSILGYRGGFQLKPITIVNAGEYTSAKNIPLVVSTPFSIIKTLDLPSIQPANYFIDVKEIEKYYKTNHHFTNPDFKKLNVIIIAMESFSKEYIGSINGKGVGSTPFIDSLIKESLIFTNAFSNGKKSIEGIPSITASIPTWMNEAYITSAYGSNQIHSTAHLLKKEGYYTAFFHGATNGSMGFDAFSSLAGYTDYYGRYEYSNDEDYDGSWGIWDEEFLQYTAQTLNKKQQPFLATIFTLTSHHPYTIPAKHQNNFKDGVYENSKCISYSDYSLKRFFESVKKMPWYNNTLFVLCADHTGISGNDFYMNEIGNNAIPIIYYMSNSNLKGIDTTVTQQIDIMPSILHYLNYNKPFFSYGNSVFDTTANHFALAFNSGIYQYIDNSYSLQFDGEKASTLFLYKKDSLLKNNLIDKEKNIATALELKTKAIIQTYQQSLINNKME